MDQQTIEYLNAYENKLMQGLLGLCTDLKLLDGRLLETPDISDKWHGIDAEYVADAVKEFAQYPTVALGWAMYVGMAVARYWDEDWSIYDRLPNLYLHIRDKRGFDYLDEVVRGEVLCLKDEAYTRCEDQVRTCSQFVLDQMHHEQVEAGSAMAFHVYARSIKVLYRVGAAVELRRSGYNLVAVNA